MSIRVRSGFRALVLSSMVALSCLMSMGTVVANAVNSEEDYDHGTVEATPLGEDGALDESSLSSDLPLLADSLLTQETQLTDPRENPPYRGPAVIDLNPEPRDDVNSWAAQFEPGAIKLISAYSPSMEREIPLLWFPAKDQTRPTPVIYVLPGRFGGETGEVPLKTTMVTDFPSHNINVITPIPGAYTNYLDWLNPDEHVGGRNYWETFFTKELPEPLNEAINGSGQQAIFGGSASGSTVLSYAIHNPGLYASVASVSGCSLTNGPITRLVQNRVIAPSGADPENMLGERNSAWARYNDPYTNLIGLKDQPFVFAYSGTGLLGDYELGPHGPQDYSTFMDVMVVGGIIEAGVNWCTHMTQAKANQLGLSNFQFEYSPVGTHAGNYMQNVMDSYLPILLQAFFGEDTRSFLSSSSSE